MLLVLVRLAAAANADAACSPVDIGCEDGCHGHLYGYACLAAQDGQGQVGARAQQHRLQPAGLCIRVLWGVVAGGMGEGGMGVGCEVQG